MSPLWIRILSLGALIAILGTIGFFWWRAVKKQEEEDRRK